MADALDLSEALASERFDTVAQAIASFEQRMGQRVAVVATETRQLLEMMRAENNQQLFLDFFASVPAPPTRPETAS